MNSPQEYADNKQSIEEELARRIADHRARFGRRQAMMTLMSTTIAPPSPASLAEPLNLIAQGDSWFDYPLPVLSPSDIIAHLKAMPLSPIILSLAHHGEAAEDMLGVKKLHRLIEQLESGQEGSDYDAILFSGGGNDLAGDQFRLWLSEAPNVNGDPAQGLQEQRVDSILGVVKAAYLDLIAARDKIAKARKRRIPIFAHSYDFAIPTGKGVCGAGPWLKPGLDDRGWNSTQGQAIVKALLTKFAHFLDSLQTPHSDFIHVRTQGSLNAGQWANELHPTPEGFSLISSKFVGALREVFPGRI